MAGSTEVTNVVVRLGHADLELGVARDVELLASAGLDPLGAAVELVFAEAPHALHDFRGTGVEGQGGGQDHAHRHRSAVGACQAVADALAVKVDVGLGFDGNAVDFLGGHGWCLKGGGTVPRQWKRASPDALGGQST